MFGYSEKFEKVAEEITEVLKKNGFSVYEAIELMACLHSDIAKSGNVGSADSNATPNLQETAMRRAKETLQNRC